MTATSTLFRKLFARSLFISALIVSNHFATAQSTIPDAPKVNIPTSPEAAMIKRFGDIPIGYYTGTANIAVPMYAISEGNVTVPLSLNYHSSGIKVEDQATWVGLGWELAPEGQIIQEVRGKNDDVDFYNVCTGTSYYDLFLQRFTGAPDYAFLFQWGRVNGGAACLFNQVHPAPWNSPYEDPYCIIDQLLRGVGQPDIYNYSFGNYSGRFYINPQSHEVINLDKKEGMLFERQGTTAIKATTPDGVVYNFAVIEMADAGSLSEYTGKTYKLSNITFINGKTIDFTYTDQHYGETIKTESADAMGIETLGITFSYTSTTRNKKALTRITSADTYIDFNMTTRDDINMASSTDNVKKLSSIDITSRASGKKVKSFEFTYTYFPASGSDNLSKRLKLDQVKEIGYKDDGTAITTIPATQFGYDVSVMMPPKNSDAVDFWGYYNAAYNNTKVPDLNYFDYHYKPEYATINLAKKYQYTGSTRFANNTTAGAYMLNKITYPTGGYTDFGYEANSFTNQFIPDLSQPFFKNKQAEDNSINSGSKTVSFKLSRTTTIHFENSINNGKGNYNGVTPLTYAQMQGCYIKLQKFSFVGGVPTFTVIKTWDLSTVLNVDFTNNGGKTWSEDLRVDYDPNPDPYFNFQVAVEYPDNLNNVLFASIAGVVSRFTFYDETGVDVSESRGGGMRIKTIKNYTETGKLASDKLIKYYNGKLLNSFKPMSVYYANKLDVSGVTGGNGYEYIGFYKKMTVPDRDFGMAGGNPIGYGRVEEIELTQGTAQSGKKVYTYYNEMNKTAQGRPYTPNGMNGEVLKEEVYDASNVLVTDKTYTYNYVYPAPAKFMCINTVKLALGSKVPCEYQYTPTPYTTHYYNDFGSTYYAALYGYNMYMITGEYHKLTQVVSRNISNGITASNTESYAYNGYGILSYKGSTNSKGESAYSNYYHSTEYYTQPGYSFMYNKNMINQPVIIENFVAGQNVSGQKVEYQTFAGIAGYWPKFTYQHILSNPLEITSTIDSYDDKANITQYTGRDGIPISIVWSTDKTLPVAKVENATYASLLALPGGLAADFRTLLPNARVTTYTYNPLVGVTTITDVNNRKLYYEYDAFNRLSLIRDHDNNILKKMCYNYAGQLVDCGGAIVCPPATHGVVNGTNASNLAGYVATFTLSGNPAVTYSFSIANGSAVALGCLPKGLYSLIISKPSGGLVSITFGCNGNFATGTSGTFSVNNNVVPTTNISIAP